MQAAQPGDPAAVHVAAAGRCGVSLTQRWVSEAHEGSEMNGRKLVHWACCNGQPVFGFRDVFTEVSFTETVEAAQLLMDDQELIAVMADPVNIRDLFPVPLTHRLVQAALSAISP
jgi:hypothetical protein